ncbi:MAG TPA: hypothetical protein PLV13_11425, partial [Ilumatobacteraceae bacterium]|nr:hypothetical protein [Ilumatobacteraceae bacterium]
MTTILLTGATGYIASHTWLALEGAGFSVGGVDDFSNSSPVVLERLIDRHPNSPEREAGFALWIRSLVEAGRVDRLDAGVKRFLETYPA